MGFIKAFPSDLRHYDCQIRSILRYLKLQGCEDPILYGAISQLLFVKILKNPLEISFYNTSLRHLKGKQTMP